MRVIVAFPLPSAEFALLPVDEFYPKISFLTCDALSVVSVISVFEAGKATISNVLYKFSHCVWNMLYIDFEIAVIFSSVS